jgi:hypothetical protein
MSFMLKYLGMCASIEDVHGKEMVWKAGNIGYRYYNLIYKRIRSVIED